MLPLTAKGLHRLATKTFNGADPDLSLIALPGEKPAGLYMWGTYAPGVLASGISLFMNEIAAEPYDGVNLYSRPNTPEGVRYNEALGLRKSPTIGAVVAPHLYEFVRKAKPAPAYDTYRSGASRDDLSVKVAHSFDDLMRVVSIRSAVYIGEQECPYDEEYDGNDMSGTHLLGFVGNVNRRAAPVSASLPISQKSSGSPCARNSATRVSRCTLPAPASNWPA